MPISVPMCLVNCDRGVLWGSCEMGEAWHSNPLAELWRTEGRAGLEQHGDSSGTTSEHSHSLLVRIGTLR